MTGVQTCALPIYDAISEFRYMLESGYKRHFFISCEPLLGPIKPEGIDCLDWLIIGANSTRGAKKPKTEWAERLRGEAYANNIPVFVKNNWPWIRDPDCLEGWPQEFPEGMK